MVEGCLCQKGTLFLSELKYRFAEQLHYDTRVYFIVNEALNHGWQGCHVLTYLSYLQAIFIMTDGKSFLLPRTG